MEANYNGFYSDKQKIMINAAYTQNGVGGIFVFLAAIIGGENIYRDVRPEPERIHENVSFVNIC